MSSLIHLEEVVLVHEMAVYLLPVGLKLLASPMEVQTISLSWLLLFEELPDLLAILLFHRRPVIIVEWEVSVLIRAQIAL